jgi:ribosomal protein S18 acetylase RimI-like enzyme
VTELRAATPAESQAWRDDWQARIADWYAAPDAPAAWADEQVANRQRMLPAASAGAGGDSDGGVYTVIAGGAPAGQLAVSFFTEAGQRNAMLADLVIAPDRRRQGHGRAALAAAAELARQSGARALWLITNPADPAHAALFGGCAIRSRQMIKQLDTLDRLAAGVSWRPMNETEFAAWFAASVQEYATEMADSGTVSASAALGASEAQHAELLPDGLGTAGNTFLCVEAGGEVTATNWIRHHRWPSVSWVYGVEVHQGYRGRGYGRAAMAAGEQATVAAGDTHLALNVFGHNAVAISMYERMGYRAYDHGRSADL